MIKLEKGKIKINSDLVLWSIFFILISFIALRKIVPFLYLSQLLVCFFITTWIIKNNKKFLTKYTIIHSIYLIWTGISILWAKSTSLAVSSFLSVAQIVIICCLISYYCDSVSKIEMIISMIAWAGIIMIIYLLLVTPKNEWVYALKGSFTKSTDEGRIGYSIGVHPNAMGTLCSIISMVFIYKLDTTKIKRYYFYILILIIILLFTKSRISLFMFAAEVIGYIILRKKRTKRNIFIIPLIILLFIISCWSIFNISILYDLIGFRLEGILGIFSSNKVTDASTITRMFMINIGIKIFSKSPILGIGSGNYAYYAYNFYGLFKQVYSHSNYIELLCNIGLVGFILYYSIPIWSAIVLYKLLKYSYGEERKLTAFLFILVSIPIITDIGKISYNNEITQIINVLAFSYAIINMKKVVVEGE